MSDSVSEHESDSDNEQQCKEDQSKVESVQPQAEDVHGNKNWQDNLQIDEGGSYIYTNHTNGLTYKWSDEEQRWIQMPAAAENTDVVQTLKSQAGHHSGLQPWEKYLQENEQGQEYTYTDPADGTVFFWDPEKRAWFPKVDENFIAAYQANYGIATEEKDAESAKYSDSEKPEDLNKAKEDSKKEEGKDVDNNRKRKADEKGWFDVDPEHNHNVYVSGLPSAFTDDEFFELMSKCGIIMDQADTQKPKCRLYRDSSGNVKGDGLCCYLRAESVTLALQILDESDVKDHTIHVERAIFQLKGEYDPSRKPKKKKKKKKGGQEKLLDWVDRDRKRSKYDKIVILKNMFNIAEFENNPGAVNEIKDEVKSECSKFGDIRKIIVFDRNPDGVCSVCFVEPQFADACIEALNGRWFGGKVISAERYDGVTQYHIQETEEELEARIRQWEDFIEADAT